MRASPVSSLSSASCCRGTCPIPNMSGGLHRAEHRICLCLLVLLLVAPVLNCVFATFCFCLHLQVYRSTGHLQSCMWLVCDSIRCKTTSSVCALVRWACAVPSDRVGVACDCCVYVITSGVCVCVRGWVQLAACDFVCMHDRVRVGSQVCVYLSNLQFV